MAVRINYIIIVLAAYLLGEAIEKPDAEKYWSKTVTSSAFSATLAYKLKLGHHASQSIIGTVP